MSTPAKFTITVRAQMSFDAYFQLYVKRIGFPAYTIDESAVLSRSQANEFTQSNNYIQQAQNIATALNADKGDAPISVTTQDNIVIIEALTDGCVIDIFKITGAWALSTTTEAIVETCDATVTVSQDSGDPVNNVMQQISIDTQFAYPLNLYCGGENNIINGHGIGYLIISATNQSELRCGIGRLTSDFTPREWVIRKVENNIVKMQSVVGAPTVSMFNIVSVTISNNGTSFTPNIEITNGDYGLYLEVAIVETTFCPLADHLSIVLTPNTDYLLYVRDQFGGILTFPFRSTWVPEVEPVPIVFADRDQQVIYPLTVEAPEGANMVRAMLRLTFPATNKVIDKSLPASGIVNFDINSVLWGELVDKHESQALSFFTFPAEGVAVNRAATHLMSYIVDEGYSYADADMELHEVITTDNVNDPDYLINYAIWGGGSRAINSYLKSVASSLYQYFNGTAVIKFLTWIPDFVPMHPRQPQRLWCINNNNFTDASVAVQITYTDGTQSAVLNKGALANDLVVWEMAIGAEELQLHQLDIAKKVATYQVWIQKADGTKVSETKSFLLDWNYYRRNDVLFFRNSLGFHETIWLHGSRVDSDKITRTEGLRPESVSSTFRGSIISERAIVSQGWTMNSGYFPKKFRNWVTEFLTSRDVVMPVNQFMLPIIITEDKFDKGDDLDDLFAFSFTAKLAHNESHYSAIPDVPSPWGDFNNDFNKDFYI